MSGTTIAAEAFEAAIAQARRHSGEAAGIWANAERYGVHTTVGDSGIPCIRAAEYHVQQGRLWADIARAILLADLTDRGVVAP